MYQEPVEAAVPRIQSRHLVLGEQGKKKKKVEFRFLY